MLRLNFKWITIIKCMFGFTYKEIRIDYGVVELILIYLIVFE